MEPGMGQAMCSNSCPAGMVGDQTQTSQDDAAHQFGTGGDNDLNSKIEAPCRDSCVAVPTFEVLNRVLEPLPKGRDPEIRTSETPGKPAASLVSPSHVVEDLRFQRPSGGSTNSLGNCCEFQYDDDASACPAGAETGNATMQEPMGSSRLPGARPGFTGTPGESFGKNSNDNNCPAAGLDTSELQVSSGTETGGHLRMHRFENPEGEDDMKFGSALMAKDGDGGSDSNTNSFSQAQAQVQTVAQGRGTKGSAARCQTGAETPRGACTEGSVKRRQTACTDGSAERVQTKAETSSSAEGSAERFQVRHAAQVCRSCGHDEGTALCCMSAKRNSRAGERQRQEAKRRRKEQAEQEEAASLRPRAIPSIDNAQTTAQLVMARMRARIATKPE